VRQTIELRDLSSEKLLRLAAALRARAQEIAKRTGCDIQITPLSHNEGATASAATRRVIGKAAGTLAYDTYSLPSGAGHDAQAMAALGPMGMIFVPSIDGISHSPKELTSWEHCGVGADVLLHSVLQADQTEMTA
jgi:N-carbamoyl-L-amino-acid hydrolase